MTQVSANPTTPGQLVWCSTDPSLGVGVVTGVEHGRVRVRFMRLGEERAYTTRGESLIRRYLISKGERVRWQGSEYTVDTPLRIEDGLAVYRLEDGEEVAETELEPEVRQIGAKVRLSSLNLVHPEVVRTRVRGVGLSKLWPRSGVSAALGARAQWLPHQIDVASRALDSDPVRLLLADEVGLGKTVEAALIFAGLRHEGRAERVLVLTPNSLTIQWLGEIYRKAHELLVLLDKERIDDAMEDFPELGPFEGYRRVLMSMDDLAKDPDLATLALMTPWDLVIVDEAHHLRWSPEEGGNAQYRLVEGLAERSQNLLLLTATPMALDPNEYHALLRLLDPVTFDDPRVFGDASERTQHIRHLAQVLQASLDEGKALSKSELGELSEFLADDEIDTDTLKRFADSPSDEAERRILGSEVLEALRVRHPIADYVVRNRRGPVGGLPDRQPKVVMLEPPALQEHLIEVGESVMFDLADTIEDADERHRVLGRVLRALWSSPRALVDILRPVSPTLAMELQPYVDELAALGLDEEGLPLGDVRLRWLISMLRQADENEKLLVFVETDIAVRALNDALSNLWGGEVALFHRGLSPRDQDRQVAWFREPSGPKIMLSTEAGGEGRNFQFCHRVVLYDLPWRPATVEQRIGRVDRVGQTRDVEVLVPCFKGGYEAAVLKVMQDSIGVLNETVGGIDYQLEFVAAQLAELIHTGASGEDWKALYTKTSSLVNDTRARIAEAADPVLDHASFSPLRVGEVMERVPELLEERLEEFVEGFSAHTSLELHQRGPVIHVEGAPGAVGTDSNYVATYSRTHALDHEEVEFLSFGHPLIEHALDWAKSAEDVSAALAVVRGDRDGAAFVWVFDVDVPEDLQPLLRYFDLDLMTIALDERGKREPSLEPMLEGDMTLQRMDPTPLRAAGNRWSSLVENNFDFAEKETGRILEARRVHARERLDADFAKRRRVIERHLRRGQQEEGFDPLQMHDDEHQRLSDGLELVRANLLASVALRITKVKSSGVGA